MFVSMADVLGMISRINEAGKNREGEKSMLLSDRICETFAF